jgi:hypothetical protein
VVSSYLAAVRDLEKRERFGAVTTVVAGPDLGAKAIIEADVGYISGSLPDDLAADVLADASALIAHEQSRTLQYGDREVFIETLAPQPRLLIFGAGHIAQSLAAMAPELGYQVIVADARKTWATSERFPNVDRLVVAWPDKVLADIEPDARTYVVLLSHDARFEDPVFPAVRHTPLRYLGALGARPAPGPSGCARLAGPRTRLPASTHLSESTSVRSIRPRSPSRSSPRWCKRGTASGRGFHCGGSRAGSTPSAAKKRERPRRLPPCSTLRQGSRSTTWTVAADGRRC